MVQSKGGVSLYAGFSVMMFSYWAMCCSGAFHSTYLEGLGLDSMEVGVAMAVNYGVGMLSPPIWARFADRTRNIKGMFQLSTCLMAAILLALVFIRDVKIGSFPLAVAVFPLYFACYSATYSLLDSWTVKVSNQTGKMSYAQIRLYGSLGYAAASMLVSWIAGFGGIVVPYFAGFVIGVFVLGWSRGRPQPQYDEHDGGQVKGGFGTILKDRRALVFIVFAFTINVCLVSPITYMPWVLDGIGADKAIVGSIGGFKALMEAVIIFIAGRYLRSIRPQYILLAAGACFVADQLSYLAVGQLWHVFAIQVVEGAAYGLYLSCATQYMYNIAPKELTASAQSVLVTASFAGNITSNLLGGWIIGMAGVDAFFTTTAALMAAGILMLGISAAKQKA